MFNLLKAELFRFYKATAFKVMIIITAAISFLTMLVIKITPLLMHSSPSESSLAQIFTGTISNGTFILISIAFIAIFCNADRKSGAIKNMASRINKKEYLAVSKLIIVILIYAVIFLGWYIIALISGKIMLGSYLNLSFSSQEIRIIAFQFLLHVTFGTVIMMLTILANNASIPITFGYISASGLLLVFYSLINLLIKLIAVKLMKKPECNFDIAKFSLINNIQSLSNGIATSDQVKSLIIGLVYLAVAITISMLIYKKRDI